MRVPAEHAAAPVRSLRRYQVGLLAAIVVIIFVLVLLQSAANFFTNYLWYRSVAASQVWRTMVGTKLELGTFFTGVFFIACWSSLWVVDKIAPRALFMSPELELVRRYQTTLGRHRVAVRTIVSLLVALAVGAGTNAQWQHWLLYLHGGQFGTTDPLFHRDIGYFVFKLPFISFLVNWLQLSLFVLLAVSAVAHYFNGGLRFSGPAPRVDPRTTAHLSAILAALALLRAVAYFYVDRYALDLSSNGVVAGAGYTDVHVRLPALELLAVVALAAFVLFVYNIYYRSWLLPAVGAGLWALIALTLGVIFPAAVQWLQVNPSASTVELPYISNNMSATRTAMGLSKVVPVTFQGNTRATSADVLQHNSSFQDMDLWDTSNAELSLQKMQSYRSYYSLSGTSIDRYLLGTGSTRRLTPVVMSVRQVEAGQLTRQTWVNTHLQYTHGYGAVVSPANQLQPSGLPTFDVSGVPTQYSAGAPHISQPDIYYGTGMSGYVVVDTKQPELDYEQPSGSPIGTHYNAKAGGGIRVGGFWTRAAFALRFHDFNLLVSHLVTPDSRVLFVQDVRARVQRAAPFLHVDSHPYPIIDNGQIEWVMDAYTTTSYFPYGQPADTSSLPPTSGLAGNYNYVRDSVKAVVNAYTGKVTFYAMTTSDPILRMWERVFPHMFLPRSQMDPTLTAHLRYPQDLLSVQAAMYGLYHVTSPAVFYGKEDAWSVAQTGGDAFSPRVTPAYELLQLPGEASGAVGFDAVIPMQPISATTNRSQSLTSFLVAPSASTEYGSLAAYVIPRGTNVPSLATVNSEMLSDHTVSLTITQLNQQKSEVLLGPTLLVPVDSSIVWVRSLFVTSTTNLEPVLREVIVDYGGTVSMRPTLLGPSGALAAVFGSSVSTIGTPGGKTSISGLVRTDLATAYSYYEQAEAARQHGNVALYLKDLELAGSELKMAVRAEHGSSGTTPGSTSGSGSNSSGTGSGSPAHSGTSTSPSSTTATTTASSSSSTSAARSPTAGSGSTFGPSEVTTTTLDNKA